jgi:UDP-3-O-[3-hydroxymyristoyl] glucosamine N-acyltransferase
VVWVLRSGVKDERSIWMETMYTVAEIAEKIGGTVFGDPKAKVESVCIPEELMPGSIVFIKDRRRFDEMAKSVKPLCVVVDFEPDMSSGFDYIVIAEDRNEKAFITLLSLFQKSRGPQEGISDLASISHEAVLGKTVAVDDFVKIGPRTRIGDGTSIGVHCFIGEECTIGSNCIIYPNVTIYPNTVIGDGVIVQSGVVIGGDGFSYTNIDGYNRKVPQIGGVLIEDNVEIGANTTIDRATIGYTKIGKNTKIDNLVQIAHNVIIGENSIVCGLCGISGSVKIGSNVVLAGAVGLADHIVLEDDVIIGAKSGVMEKHVKRGSKMLGYPAIESYKQLKSWAMIRRLEGMYSDLAKIKKQLGIDS